MTQTRLWVAATIIACIILAGFILFAPHNRAVAPTTESSIAGTQQAPSVALRDTFKKGMHTITGSVIAPDACTSVSAEATLAGTASSTQSILVAVSMPADSGICLQVATPMSFTTTLSAPAHLPLAVTVNGTLATTTSL
ncbi:MAG: hypothetical protein ACHQU0_03135 [Candidatus Paceibacteria bacterium]